MHLIGSYFSHITLDIQSLERLVDGKMDAGEGFDWASTPVFDCTRQDLSKKSQLRSLIRD